jgi:hypothetical protein
MTDLNTRHPEREGAAGNADTVRDALAWSRKRQADLLQIYGATPGEVQEWITKTTNITNKLLRKIERRHSK